MRISKKHIMLVQDWINNTIGMTLHVDGKIGNNTKRALDEIKDTLGYDISSRGSKTIATLQHIVGAKIDGFYGLATEQKYLEYIHEFFDRDSVDSRTDSDDFDRTVIMSNPNNWAESYSEIVGVFGNAGDQSNMVTIILPYSMRLAWDKEVTVSRILVHKLIAKQLIAAFEEILTHYTIKELRAYGLDLYGGCYNLRKMRGGSKMSTHSWAISIDMNPSNNRLRTKWSNSDMSNRHNKKFVQAFYNQGFINLGLEKNYDSMHFSAVIG